VSSTRIAVLLTCHNRVERTLACLASLVAQSWKTGEIKVVLVDAGSVDGTVEQVRRHHPAVAIVEQSPDLYWNGGMRVALAHAHEFDPDYYLWLNDDVELDPDAVQRLLECDRQLVTARPARRSASAPPVIPKTANRPTAVW
jgi:GT2 family glycosyltransferase